MSTIKERVWVKSIVDEHDRQKVMNCIAEKKVVSLETILEKFPWIRWGDLFLIVGGFQRKGLVTVNQTGFLFEVRLKDQHIENYIGL